MPNPLLTMEGLPPFSTIKAAHVRPAVETVLAENRERLQHVLASDGEPSWRSLVEPLDDMSDRLGHVCSPARHMNSVVNTPELREQYNACLPLLSDYSSELGQNAELYARYEQLSKSAGWGQLETGQQKAVEDELRDFRLSGVALPAHQKERFRAIRKELAALQARFSDNVLDATNAWTKHINDESELAGLPASALAMAAQSAVQRDLDGWCLSLEFPSYHAVVTYADNRALRAEVYEAFNTRASDQGPHAGQFDNSEIMDNILALRQEGATLLGFANYAEQSLVTKMAATPQVVLDFLNELVVRAKPVAEREIAGLQAFAHEELGIDDLQPWDVPYASEKLRQQRYALSQEDLKPYFPVDDVIAGLFKLTGRLYGVTIKPRADVDTWHPDARFYEIHDSGGVLRGQFYLDLFARENKRGGAWMDECITRRRLPDGSVRTPVAYMTCNAAPPVDGKPALFTHDEVLTLFHEFGHGLHHMLTLVDYPAVSGINGVEWDAVELPSQFMENWCWERSALDLFARHHETGEPLPAALYDKLIASRHFHTGMQMLRQLEFSLFDFRLHLEYRPDEEREGRNPMQRVLDDIRTEVAVVTPPAFVRFQHGFSHIFAGGYAAGYYSYKWAEVLSADVYAAFEEEGLLDGDTGERFLHSVLERGGTRPAMALFKEFRAREPKIDALLRHSGLAA